MAVLGRFQTFFNSAFGIWLLTSIFGGLGVWQFERYLDSREHRRSWEETQQRLGLEYEARLSQYSGWFLTLLQEAYKPDEYAFKTCVTPSYLRSSINVLSGRPNFATSEPPGANSGCEQSPRFQALFPEYAETSTVGVLIELRIANERLFPIHWVIDPEDHAPTPQGDDEAQEFRRHVFRAINGFLNPHAVIPLETRALDANTYRTAFEDSFYGIGPAELWHSEYLGRY